MHRVNPLLRFKLLILLFIGSFSFVLNAEVEEPDLESLQEKHLVFVEPDYATVTRVEEEYALIPYAERRGHWGFLIGAEYSSYEPTNYEPNFANADYKTVYSVPTTPMLELHLQLKRNFAFGSIGAELLAGTFKNGNSDDAFVGSSLALTQLAFSLTYNMDTLFREPYAVPFISGGAYSMLYSEVLESQSFNGNTQPAPFFGIGCAFQLDWIDHHAALTSYQDSHLQSTYLFIEGRKYFKSSVANDPDFSNDFNYAGGLRFEF